MEYYWKYTPLNVFDSSKEKNPNLINPGDIIIF